MLVDGVAQPPGGKKLGSEAAPTLRLRRNPKLIDTLRARSRNRALCVVGFKLTRGATVVETQQAVGALFARGAVDHVVHNDLAAREAEGGAFPADIWHREGAEITHCDDRADLALALEQLLTAGSGRATL
ncbi:MAG: hypothetical protein NTV51_05160 [Verrucomicrobia bacterium]|nr:hypothetical protein [Verrucomicrobiota bacterium]